MRLRTGSGLVNPAKLVNALARAALNSGVQIYTQTPVTSLKESASTVHLTTPLGQLSAQRVVLATNAFTPLRSSIKHRVMPIFDHVLATRVLTEAELRSVGWSENQGVTDSGNQFHYYRKTADNRILWGGYDANYYFGNDTSPAREQRRSSHELLARQFFDTFPTLADVTFDYAWAGLIDSTSRFTPFYELSRSGRVGTVVGFTGLGVGSSRFGAKVILDLLWNRETALTRLEMVRKKPVPVPPEPLRYPIIAFTRAMLTREDRTGKRGLYLKLLDLFGVGFNS
jgi:glycine/D-amino acid oxidase-like deaminating enzyme